MYVAVMAYTEDTGGAKAFMDARDAYACYERFAPWVGKGGFYSMSLYEVADSSSPAEAVDLVRSGASSRITLLRLQKRTGSRWLTLPDNMNEQLRRYWD